MHTYRIVDEVNASWRWPTTKSFDVSTDVDHDTAASMPSKSNTYRAM